MRREQNSLLIPALACVVSLVVGVIVGGLGPRNEARQLREEVAALSKQSCDKPALGREVARAFSRRPWSTDASPPEPEPAAPRERPGFVPSDDAPFDDPVGSVPPDIDRAEGLAMARDAMQLRRRQALRALTEQARMSDAEMRDVEAAFDDMNAELLGLAEGFVATVRQGEPERRDIMVFAAETLDVLIEADDRLFGLIDPDRRGDVSAEALDPMSYVDPALIDVLMELDAQ